MKSLVGLTFIENSNKLYLLHCLSESNKVLYMDEATLDKLEQVKNFVTIAKFSVPAFFKLKHLIFCYRGARTPPKRLLPLKF